MATIPGAIPRRRATEQFGQEVFHTHQAAPTQLQLSKTHHISCCTVEDRIKISSSIESKS